MKKILPVLSFVIASAAVGFTGCNKEIPDAVPVTVPPVSGSTIAQLLDDANYSILKAALTRAGLLQKFADTTAVFTVLAPDNDAFIRSGIPSVEAIAVIPVAQLQSIINAHAVGGERITAAAVPAAFPNMYLQTNLVLAPPSPAVATGLRMPVFLGKQGTALFANNVPVVQADISAANGIVHKVAALVAPPTSLLWNMIDTGAAYSYLKAAIIKGDPEGTLRGHLQNPAANFTVFAPTNTAFQQLLTAQITAGLLPVVRETFITNIIAQLKAATPTLTDEEARAGALAAVNAEPVKTQITTTATTQATALASTPDVFTNPALATVLTPQLVQGLVVYHIVGKRAFSVNVPTNELAVPTLLNTAIAAHPGVSVKSVFTGTMVSAITVKGAANANAANVLINPLPGGTSDQNFVNGVIHRIDQVLLPQ